MSGRLDYHADFRHLRLLLAARRPLAIAGLSISIMAVVLQFLGLGLVFSPPPASAAMHPVTSLTIGAFSLVLLGDSTIPRNRPLHRAVLWALLTLCVLRVLVGLGNSSMIHALVPIAGARLDGQFSLQAATVLGLQVAAALLRTVFPLASDFLAGFAVFVLFNAFVGLSYGLPLFDGDLSLPTLVALSCTMAASGLLLVRHPGPRALLRRGPVGQTLRQVSAGVVLSSWGGGLFLVHYMSGGSAALPVAVWLITVVVTVTLSLVLYTGVKYDRAERAHARTQRALLRMAYTDPLTGIANRRGGSDALSRLWQAQGRDSSLAVAVLDIDHFKRINDQYGHAAGDEVLQVVAQALQSALCKGAILCRWGGEEFLVASDRVDAEQACAWAEDMRKSLHELAPGLGLGALSASIGLAFRRPGDMSPDIVIRRADAAMYRAKRKGRNRVVAQRDVA